MAYEDRSVYNKYPVTSTSEDDNCCGDSGEDCSCCPPGLVAIYNEDGTHQGCVTPNDAEEYQNGTHVPAEGYVKVYHPTTNEYLGDLTSQQAIDLIDYLANGNLGGAVAETFNILNPEPAASGFYEINVAASAGETSIFELLIDRIGLTDAVVVSITNSAQPFEFDPSGTSVVIPVDSSSLDAKIVWTGIAAGTYTLILEFAVNAIVKQLPVRITLT